MINFNTAPYFDDFDPKNRFYRILFRPSYAVQGRELTQVQSILQHQIELFGNHIFEEGAMVIPGQITFDQEVSYQKMVSTYGNPPDQVFVNPEDFLGQDVIGESSGVEGTIINVAPADENDPLTFFIKFKDSGKDKQSIGFWDGETIYRKNEPQIRAIVAGDLDEINPTYESNGKAAIASIEQGVYYFNGIFFENDAQSIVLSKYDQYPTCKVGLRIYEDIITPEDDLSLTDNAKGSPNYAAPGAHRYKVSPRLETIGFDEDPADNFIVLQIIKTGVVLKEIRTSDYSELEKTFARRTFDESGNYTVEPFSVLFREHYRSDTDEKYKEGVNYPPIGDKSLVVAEMGTGKAYVQGYEIAMIAKSHINLRKAQDFAVANNSVTNFSLGSYVIVKNIHNIPRIDEFGKIYLYASVSTPGTNNGDKIGECKVRSIKMVRDTYYLYLFDINMDEGHSFESEVKWFYDSNGSNYNNFTCEAVLEDGACILRDTSHNTLLFDLPHSTIKTLSVGGAGIDTNYYSLRAFFNNGVMNGTATLTARDNEVFQQNVTEYLVYDATTGNMVQDPTFAFTGSPTGKVLEVGNLSGPVNIVAPVVKTIAIQKTKNIQTDETKSIAEPNKVQNGRDYLGKADVIQLKAVYMSADKNTPATTDDTDVTSRYELDGGQRDNYYDIGSIILKGGSPAPTGQLLVVFDYYTHTTGDYFSVDSYVDDEYDSDPQYISPETGKIYHLYDCFDFRPRMSDDRTGFVGIGASIGELPQPFSDITADYEYYLNRIDYIYLDYRGMFAVAEGVPAVYPKPPETPETGMVLYEVNVPAYTFNTSDIQAIYKDNKRYTMHDIGDLDRRIGNLEYYTTLSMLERQTASMEILDQNGMNRFKNGFIVDPFDSHMVGDATHSDYQCSIDPNEKLMRPKFSDENIGLLFDEDASNHVVQTGSIITLPYTEVGINGQLQASKYENINPFAFRNIFAKVSFNPDSDVWHDKKTTPTLIVNHSPNYEALKFIADNDKSLNGIEWGRWNDVGGRKNVKTTVDRKTKRSRISRRGRVPHSQGWLKDTVTTTTTATTTWQQGQSRTGTQIKHKDSNVISKSLGKRVTDVNYIPYMRSIPIIVKSNQMKKKTKVYPFFDGVAMSKECEPPALKDYCTPASVIHCSQINGKFRTADHNEEIIVGEQSGAFGLVMFQTENTLSVVNVRGTFVANEIVKGTRSGASATVKSFDKKSLGDSLYTGEAGEIALVWQIPNDANLKFMTGEREFVLTDQITNDDPVHTKASGMFKSHGMSSKQQDTVLSTKTITFSKRPVRQSRQITRQSQTSKTNVKQTGWFDPLAQSFLIQESGGCFLTKINVWFQSKDPEEPVVCQIRNMVNGYPAEIFMATTTLLPEDVKVSERAPGEPTTFVFPEPVYLKEGESYCFVLLPAVESANYNVWVAENGKVDINTGEIITGKESLGSLFKSQNASTWTPNQNEDIMFQLYKAKFDIGTEGLCSLVNAKLEPDELETNPTETQKTSNLVRFYIDDHGLFVGSKVYIEGFEDNKNYNGFLGSQLNGLHDVYDVEVNCVVIKIDGVYATEDGMTGGEGIKLTRNYQLDVARPIVNELIVQDTDVTWKMQTVSGKSVSGSQIPFIVQPFIDCINNEDADMTKPMIIASEYNEIEYLKGAKSFRMNGTLKSDNENVSPVIDAASLDPNATDDKKSTSTLITIANRIDWPSITQKIIVTNDFSVGAGEDELVINHPNHEMGTGAMIYINNFTDIIPGVTEFDPNGLHEIRFVDRNTYIIDMGEPSSTGYTGNGGGSTTLSYSSSHFKFIPESESFHCSTAARYMTKQVSLKDPAENIKIMFGAVREQDADIDVYYKVRGPYEVTPWNELRWTRIDTPDEAVAISETNTDFKDYSYTLEDMEPFNAIAVKLVMKSTNSAQVPIFTDFRLICTT
jgi:hypothetical protein